MFKLKAPSGKPALRDSWITDPDVRTVRIYTDLTQDSSSNIVLQIFGNKRYLRAAMSSEEAKALAKALAIAAAADKS